MTTAAGMANNQQGANPTSAATRRVTLLRNIVKGMIFLSRRFAASITVIVTLSILSGIIPAVTAWIGKAIIDDIVSRLPSANRTAHLETLLFWIAASIVLGITGIAIRWRLAISQDWLQRAGAVEIDKELVDRTQKIDLLVRESPEFADRQMLVQMGTAFEAPLRSAGVSDPKVRKSYGEARLRRCPIGAPIRGQTLS